MRIEPISIPRPVIRSLPPPITNTTPPPVTSTLEVPVVEVPEPVIEYPTVDVPTREEFEGQIAPPKEEQVETDLPTRDLPATPVVDVPGVGPVPLPDPAPLVAAGATAVVVASVTMTSSVILNALKDKFLSPMIEKLKKPKKIKLKQKKPVLHFVQAENGVQIFEYSIKGTRLKDTTENIEQYLRDQVDIDSLYEYDNKLIIDDVLKSSFSKEGTKRFKKHFVPAKAIVKKLSAKFSF